MDYSGVAEPLGAAMYETYEDITEPFEQGTMERKMQLAADGCLHLASVRRTNPLATHANPDELSFPVTAGEQTASLYTELAGEDHTYEYQDIGRDGKVDSTLPRPKAQPDPDYIDPNVARGAMLAGVEHTYEYQDIGSSTQADNDNDGEQYGLVSTGTISTETTGGRRAGQRSSLAPRTACPERNINTSGWTPAVK